MRAVAAGEERRGGPGAAAGPHLAPVESALYEHGTRFHAPATGGSFRRPPGATAHRAPFARRAPSCDPRCTPISGPEVKSVIIREFEGCSAWVRGARPLNSDLAMDRERALSVYNLPFLEGLYEAYQRDPASVPTEWIPLLNPDGGPMPPPSADVPRRSSSPPVSSSRLREETTEQTLLQNRVKDLIEAYRIHGHLGASIDPLDRPRQERAPMLDPSNFGLDDAHLDRSFHSSGLLPEPAPLREILRKLRNTYCRNIGVEYWSLPASEEREGEWKEEVLISTACLHDRSASELRVLRIEAASGVSEGSGSRARRRYSSVMLSRRSSSCCIDSSSRPRSGPAPRALALEGGLRRRRVPCSMNDDARALTHDHECSVRWLAQIGVQTRLNPN